MDQFVAGEDGVGVGRRAACGDDDLITELERDLDAGIHAILRLHAADNEAQDATAGKILLQTRLAKRAAKPLIKDFLVRAGLE